MKLKLLLCPHPRSLCHTIEGVIVVDMQLVDEDIGMWSVCGVGAQEAGSDREQVGCAEPDDAQVPVEDLESEAGRVLGYIILSIYGHGQPRC